MSETDRRLKDHLNTDQAKRERMCLEILSVQKNYSDVVPRLPKGGPDGGRDIQGFYKGDLCFGAVGFVNDASDTEQHRNQAKAKFNDDLKRALTSKDGGVNQPKAFVFFTNVSLTPTISEKLKKEAYTRGISYCEIFDRELLRKMLDSNRGYAIRFRYLDISLDDSEQKEFFNAWGEEINAAVSSGFKGIDQTTKRIQFLLEAQLPLDQLDTIVKLDASVWDVCKGSFFFQTDLTLRVHSEGLIGITFGGGADGVIEAQGQFELQGEENAKITQYGFGFSHLLPDTPQHAYFSKNEAPKNGSDNLNYFRTTVSSGTLDGSQKHLFFSGQSEGFLVRFQPTCKLLELNRCMVLFECNKEIADHITEITLVSGGYELLKLGKDNIRPEKGGYERLTVPKEGNPDVVTHEWMTLRPSNFNSCFTIDLMGNTPRRYDWVS